MGKVRFATRLKVRQHREERADLRALTAWRNDVANKAELKLQTQISNLQKITILLNNLQ